MLNNKIELTIARLREIREDGQLTDGLRKRLDGVISELENEAEACKSASNAARSAKCVIRALHRVGWWLLLFDELKPPNDSGPEC